MSKGRHSANNASNNSRHKFNILPVFIFLIIVIILLLLYHFRDSIYTFFNSQNSKNISSKVENTIFSNETLNEVNIENLEVVEETTNTVENLEYLEIKNFQIDTSNPNQTKVSVFLDNTSAEDISDLHLTVTLLDENHSDIVSFDTYVSKVLSHSTKKININSKENLTNAKHIKITKN